MLPRGAVLGGTGIAAASLLATGSAPAAGDAGSRLVFPGIHVVIDSSQATMDAAMLVPRRIYAHINAKIKSALKF